MAKFVYNNSTHLATRFSPYYTIYGYHPSLSFRTPTTSTTHVADVRIKHLQEVHNEVKTMIDIAYNQAKQYYDQGVQLQPNFKIGDKVFLYQHNISITTPFKKLASKFLGSFPIPTKLLEVVYKLKLPRHLGIHNVFHMSLLQRYNQDTIKGNRQQPPPPIVMLQGDFQWKVCAILDSRLRGCWKKLQYLISWKDYRPKENSWEPIENLQNASK